MKIDEFVSVDIGRVTNSRYYWTLIKEGVKFGGTGSSLEEVLKSLHEHLKESLL